MGLKAYILSHALRGHTCSRSEFTKNWKGATPTKWDMTVEDASEMYLSVMKPRSTTDTVKRVLIYSHGNFQDVSDEDVKYMCRMLSDKLDAYVYCFEYPGYVEGSFFRIESAEDLMVYRSRMVCEKVRKIHEGRRDISYLFVGFSIGTYMALHMTFYLSKMSEVSLLTILISPLASCLSTVSSCMTADLFLKAVDCFDNKRIISDVKTPIHLIHGAKDDIVKIGHSKFLLSRHHASREQSTATLTEVSDMGHNDLVIGRKGCDFTSNLVKDIVYKHDIMK